MSEPHVTVVGAGLAGAEAAYQLLKRGVRVTLYEMKPHKRTPAHKGDGFAELVCSNSLRSDRLENAVGLLKEEMRTLGSLVMQAADATRVPAGGALAVDREGFSAYITEALRAFPNLTVVSRRSRDRGDRSSDERRALRGDRTAVRQKPAFLRRGGADRDL